MAVGKPLTPFYAGLGVVALAGVALIARTTLRRSPPPLSLDTVAPLVTGPRGVVQGAASAPVEVMEFADFECPACARFTILNMPDVDTRLVATGRVRWRFVHFPLPGHPRSPLAHLAAACANVQGRFWPMHDRIYADQDRWATARNPGRVLAELASNAGVDRAAWDRCMDEQTAWGTVLSDKALGDSLGVNATPTFYINGHALGGVPSFDELRAIVDSIAPPAATPAPR